MRFSGAHEHGQPCYPQAASPYRRNPRILLVRKVEKVVRHDDLPLRSLCSSCAGDTACQRPNSRYDQSLEFPNDCDLLLPGSLARGGPLRGIS